MAIYGIPSAGAALTASTQDDVLQRFGLSTALMTGNTLLGLQGNDVIALGAVGYNGATTATWSSVSGIGATMTLSGTLFASAGRTYVSSVSTGSGQSGLSVAVSGVVTANQGTRSLANSQVYGNEGNDSILFGNTLTSVNSVSVGGGSGNDLIGTYTYISSTVEYAGSLGTNQGGVGLAGSQSAFLVEAGGGDDTIRLIFSSHTSINANTIQGGQGNDSIVFVATASGGATSTQVLGGGGDDVLNYQVSSNSGNTIAGGGGNDTIVFSAAGTFIASQIHGDTFAQSSIYDGNDYISGSIAGAFSSNTIGGGLGNDTIYFSGGDDAGNNLYALNGGNDSLTLAGTVSASSIQAGAGQDTVTVLSSFKGGSIAWLGGDADVFTLSAAAVVDSGYAGTVFGGAGGDELLSAAAHSGGTIGITFGYSANTDSTLSAYDTIALNYVSGGGTFVFNMVQGGINNASFSGNGVTGTNGVATFTSTFSTDLTARVEALNSSVSAGGAVTFRGGTGLNYLFVQGGTSSLADDLLVQVGGNAKNSAAQSLTVAGGKNISLTLAGN